MTNNPINTMWEKAANAVMQKQASQGSWLDRKIDQIGTWLGLPFSATNMAKQEEERAAQRRQAEQDNLQRIRDRDQIAAMERDMKKRYGNNYPYEVSKPAAPARTTQPRF